MASLAVLGMGPVKAAFPHLTKRELNALEEYAGAGYHSINKYLRKEADYSVTPIAKIQEQISFIDRMIASVPVSKTDQVVYRGINFTPALKEGSKIVWPAYTSTSTKERIAKGFTEWGKGNGTIFEIIVPQGSRALDVQKVSSRVLKEHEVLLPRNSSFEVLKAPTQTDNKAILRLIP